jgi:hypothetical protein
VCNLASIALPSFLNVDTMEFDYEKLVAPLIKIVQEHRQHINTLETLLQEYRNTVEECQVRISNLEKS